MYSIALVEDDSDLQRAFVEVINNHADFHVVFAAGTKQASLDWLSKNSCDALLVDLGLPDGSGITLIEYCRAYHIETEVMVISVFGDEKNVLQAIRAGATGYLLKDESDAGIIEAIQSLLNGGSPISPAIARMVLKSVSSSPSTAQKDDRSQENAVMLTPRELDVLNCLVVGMSYQEVADRLSITIDTVRSYIKNIYRKLEVRNRGQAVYRATKLGISDTRNVEN